MTSRASDRKHRGLPLLLAIVGAVAACGGEASTGKRPEAGSEGGTADATGKGGASGSDAADAGVAGEGGAAGGGMSDAADAPVDAPADVPADVPADTGVDARPAVVNLAGNPGVELAANGSVAFGGDYTWFPFNQGNATFAQSTAQAHTGTSSALLTGRQSVFGGVGYVLPTGAGSYKLSIWILHTDAMSHQLGVTWRRCSATDFSLIAAAPVPIPPNTWTQLTATMAVPDNCIHSTIYIEQNEAMDGGTGIVSDIFADDIALEPVSVPNIVGNGGGEVAISTSGTSPWKASGCVLGQSTTFRSGLASVSCTSRTAASSGPIYYLPAGPATYNVGAFAQHSGTGPIDLALTATLSCSATANGALSNTTAVVASATTVAPNSWAPLNGTVTVPPFCTTAFLRLEQQSGAELPGLLIDDLSAALVP